MLISRIVGIVVLVLLLVHVHLCGGQIVRTLQMQRALPVRIAYQTECGQQEQDHAQDAQHQYKNHTDFRRNRFSETHQIRYLIRQRIDALLKPQNGEYDVRKIGHLLDVKHLADSQIDLDAGAHAQSGAHFLDDRRRWSGC